jgi:hypothetical protein
MMRIGLQTRSGQRRDEWADQRSKGARTFVGPIECVTFYNPESGFCVLRVKVQGRAISSPCSAAPVTGWKSARRSRLPSPWSRRSVGPRRLSRKRRIPRNARVNELKAASGSFRSGHRASRGSPLPGAMDPIRLPMAATWLAASPPDSRASAGGNSALQGVRP